MAAQLPDQAGTDKPRSFVPEDVNLGFIITNKDVLDFARNVQTGPTSKAETMLIAAATAFLRDWFPAEEFDVDNLLTLISFAAEVDIPEIGMSTLDRMFDEVENGLRWMPPTPESRAHAKALQKKKLIPDPTLQTAADLGWGWAQSGFQRLDGLKPSEDGIQPVNDFSLMCYTAFKAATPETRADAAMAALGDLVCAVCDRERMQDISAMR